MVVKELPRDPVPVPVLSAVPRATSAWNELYEQMVQDNANSAQSHSVKDLTEASSWLPFKNLCAMLHSTYYWTFLITHINHELKVYSEKWFLYIQRRLLSALRCCCQLYYSSSHLSLFFDRTELGTTLPSSSSPSLSPSISSEYVLSLSSSSGVASSSSASSAGCDRIFRKIRNEECDGDVCEVWARAFRSGYLGDMILILFRPYTSQNTSS